MGRRRRRFCRIGERHIMKLLAFTLVLLMSGAEAFAMNEDSIRTDVICEEGYKFLLVWSSQGTSPTVVQILEEADRDVNPPQPMRCGNE